MGPKKKKVVLTDYMKAVQAQLRPRARTRAGREAVDYQDGKPAQDVITGSGKQFTAKLKDEFERFVYPERYENSGVNYGHSDRQRRWLLEKSIHAFWDKGYTKVLHESSVPKAIAELVARRAIAQPWAAQYRGTGLYKGQIGSEEKAQARKEEGLARGHATMRSEAIKTRENNLDGGAAAPGLSHYASGSRQRTRGGDRVARAKKVEPPKASEKTAFLRKHRPEAKGCCDDCQRPLAPSIYSPGKRRPVGTEHQKGGRHPGRLRACLTVDEGCNQGKRAEIDAYNDGLERAGEDPMTARESARLGKFQLAMLRRLPDDDSDFDEMQRHVDDAFSAAAIAPWPALDDPQTVASTTRSDRDFGEGREEAIAARREREAAKPSRAKRGWKEALAAKAGQERAAKKAKHEAEKAAKREKYAAAKGKPRAPPARRFVHAPAPAPLGKRHCPVDRYNPADESMLTPYDLARRRRAAKASKPAKRAAPPAAKPAAKRRRR